MKSALVAEKEFFAARTEYAHLAQRQGTMFLSKKLNSILEDHIRACMPDISHRVKVEAPTLAAADHFPGSLIPPEV